MTSSGRLSPPRSPRSPRRTTTTKTNKVLPDPLRDNSPSSPRRRVGGLETTRTKSDEDYLAEHVRRARAYQWHSRWAMPNYKMMIHQVKTTPGLDITEDDVNLLPWNHQMRLDRQEYERLQAGTSTRDTRLPIKEFLEKDELDRRRREEEERKAHERHEAERRKKEREAAERERLRREFEEAERKRREEEELDRLRQIEEAKLEQMRKEQAEAERRRQAREEMERKRREEEERRREQEERRRRELEERRRQQEEERRRNIEAAARRKRAAEEEERRLREEEERRQREEQERLQREEEERLRRQEEERLRREQEERQRLEEEERRRREEEERLRKQEPPGITMGNSPIERAYRCFDLLAKPSRDTMKSAVDNTEGLEIETSDIDTLPWKADGQDLDYPKLHDKLEEAQRRRVTDAMMRQKLMDLWNKYAKPNKQQFREIILTLPAFDEDDISVLTWDPTDTYVMEHNNDDDDDYESAAAHRRREIQRRKIEEEERERLRAELGIDERRRNARPPPVTTGNSPLERAYRWYTRLNGVRRQTMINVVNETPSMDISTADVDLLPWIKEGSFLDFYRLKELLDAEEAKRKKAEGNKSGNDDDDLETTKRKRKAYKWYRTLHKPKRETMYRLIDETIGIDVKKADVDLLPWDPTRTFVHETQVL